ncbi:hypothetical protein F4776DRAFT_534614 [Hypoxylon sp. NC0597]|nr:hypothetical protein F4776DRAFT_534614 [Hypoxylon sp. NC0597]
MDPWIYFRLLAVPLAVWLWALIIGRFLAFKYRVDPDEANVLWILLKGYVAVFREGIAERLEPLIIFTGNVEKIIRTHASPALAEQVEEIKSRSWEDSIDGLRVLLHNIFVIGPRFTVWTLAHEVRRMAPSVLDVIAFILTLCYWVIWLNVMVYDDFIFRSTPEPDIVVQSEWLAWEELDAIMPHFQNAILVDRQRFRHTFDGEVIKLQNWYFN